MKKAQSMHRHRFAAAASLLLITAASLSNVPISSHTKRRETMKKIYALGDVTCSHCAQVMETKMSAIPGVTSAMISFKLK